LSDQSRRTAVLLLAPLALGAGLGLGYAVGSRVGGDQPDAAAVSGGEGGGGAGDEASDPGDLGAKLAKLEARLADNDDQLAELTEAFGQHFLVTDAFYTVTKVVDGDTFELGKWKIRLLGVNTPESVHPSQPVEWYGVESSKHLKKLIEGKRIRLEPEAGERLGTGAYNRVLAYVFLEDGTDVNAAVVKGGYGQSYHKYPCKRRAEFDALQAEAQAAKIGLWNDEARLVWEDANIIPEVPAEEATVIVSKASGTVHDVHCKAGPSPERGIYLRTLKQAAKFKFTKLHSCAKRMAEEGKP
jgi:endonuclease YncB( thermonuclease family)